MGTGEIKVHIFYCVHAVPEVVLRDKSQLRSAQSGEMDDEEVATSCCSCWQKKQRAHKIKNCCNIVRLSRICAVSFKS